MALLCGQVADGIATPIVGLLSDKYNGCWGKRNTFYIIGSIIVIPSFLCLFTAPTLTTAYQTNIWYIFWPMLFNIGWAAV
jgi:MFS family permease